MKQLQAFFGASDQQVDGYRDSDLHLNKVPTFAVESFKEPLNKSLVMSQVCIRDGMLGKKRSFSGAKARLFNDADRPKTSLDRAKGLVQRLLNVQMRLDSLKEELQSSASPARRNYLLELKRKIIDQKRNTLTYRASYNRSQQSIRGGGAGVKHSRYARLITKQLRLSPVRRVDVASLELGVAFDASAQNPPVQLDSIQPNKIQVASIKQIERTRLSDQFVQGINLVRLIIIGDLYKLRGSVSQIQQSMQGKRLLSTTKRCPEEHQKTQADRTHCRTAIRAQSIGRKSCPKINPYRKSLELRNDRDILSSSAKKVPKGRYMN
jgi:hypothetical protein